MAIESRTEISEMEAFYQDLADNRMDALWRRGEAGGDTTPADSREHRQRQRGGKEEVNGRVERPVGTLGGLCQRVAALVCSTHHDRARRGTIRRMSRSVPTSSSARRRIWRSSLATPRSRLQIALAHPLPGVR